MMLMMLTTTMQSERSCHKDNNDNEANVSYVLPWSNMLNMYGRRTHFITTLFKYCSKQRFVEAISFMGLGSFFIRGMVLA